MLYLGLIPGDYIGWGICSKYLIQELAKLTTISIIEPSPADSTTPHILDGKVFHTLGDHHLSKVFNVSGDENYGYTFFENRLPDVSVENAREFDTVFAGSTWCRDRLVERGIHWSDILIQGIDPELFYPVGNGKPGAVDYFVIFSGGKFELRKGQDIVIKAVKVMQERHEDVMLVTCWHNQWPFSMNTMVHSTHIDYTAQRKYDPTYIKKLLKDNGIDLNRTEMLPRVPLNQLRKVYACTDIGLFPNRCEGGTNLVLMEYMACAKPVVATYTSGHKDILTKENSLLVSDLSPMPITGEDGDITAVWETPNIEEVVENLEFAYQHQNRIRQYADQAGRDLMKRTWEATARVLVEKLHITETIESS